MPSTLRIVVFALWTFIPTGVLSICQEASDGQCIANNSRHIGDREVFPMTAVSCRFQGSLCQYRQGCQDETMEAWTARDGYAGARQESAGCGADVYSILESVWVNFSTPVCLQFSFSLGRPQALEVFLAPYPDSGVVRQLLSEDGNTADDGQLQNVIRTVGTSIGKLLFRIRGGGPVADGPFLKLFSISYEAGRCQTPGCSFDGSTSDPYCWWRPSGWENRSEFITVTTTDVANITSPLTRATGEERRDCLTFQFKVTQREHSLHVSVLLSGVSVTVWSWENSATTGNWNDATVQIVTRDAYRVVFSGRKSSSSGQVSVRKIAFNSGLRSGLPCVTEPEGAAVNVTLPLGPSPSEPDPSPSDPDPTGSGPQGSSKDGAVIGGVVAAVLVVVIVVVVVGFLLYRRRRQRKNTGSSGREADDNASAPVTIPAYGDTASAGNEAYANASSSLYNTTGPTSPPNPYAPLQMTSQNVTTTPTSNLYQNSIDTGATSYYNNVEREGEGDYEEAL